MVFLRKRGEPDNDVPAGKLPRIDITSAGAALAARLAISLRFRLLLDNGYAWLCSVGRHFGTSGKMMNAAVGLPAPWWRQFVILVRQLRIWITASAPGSGPECDLEDMERRGSVW